MPPIGQREVTANGLTMPNGLGDEQDDIKNWRALDQMISGTHPTVQLRSNLNPGSVVTSPYGSRKSGRSAFQARVAPSSRAAANSTIALAISQAGGFRAFRLVVRNANTTVPLNITAKAGVSATATPSGSGISPVNVTWGRDNAGALITSKTVPVGSTANMIGGQAASGVAVSDWIGLESIARTDVVGADPILYLRIASPDGLLYDPIDWTAALPVSTGRVLRSSFASGVDNVASWATAMALSAANSNILPDVCVEFLSGGRTASVAVFADSLAAGGASPTVNYILATQAKLATAGVTAGIGMYAVGGQRRQTTSANLQAVVALQKPDFVVMHDYSVNSAAAPAIAANEQWTYLCNDIAAVVANGGIPIIVTMHTNDTYAARTRAAFGGIYPIVDMAALLSNGAGGIQDQYCADPVSDRTHISALACDVVGTALSDVLVSLIPA